MWIKLIILLAFIGIVASLASSLYFLMRDSGDSKRTVRALTVRVGLSVGLFAFIMLLSWLGVITPHGVMPTPAPAATSPATGALPEASPGRAASSLG